jgi:hypothetical protein
MWSWFEDLVIDGRLLSFTDQAGIKLEGVPPDQVWEVFRGHYTRGNSIDVRKFATDLATWGPIASRVVEIQLGAAPECAQRLRRLYSVVSGRA